MKYDYFVVGESADFDPIEADDLNSAKEQIRQIVKNPSVWAHGIEPFVATVQVWQVGNLRNYEAFLANCAEPTFPGFDNPDLEPTFENQKKAAYQLYEEKGLDALREQALKGKQCGCGQCAVCAALEVLEELRADELNAIEQEEQE